ncbi:TPA: glycosyltransferase family 2 protein, partial [Streptococcus pneumoniae]
MSDLLLSFIMPTYNSAEYLADTMDSLVASIGDYNHLVEIICVDDGSWDNTVTILEGYKSIYDNLIIIRNEHGGVSQARNTALDIVSGKYISFVDSDDLYEKDFLNTFISLDKNFDFLFTDVGGLKDEISFQEINEKEKL